MKGAIGPILAGAVLALSSGVQAADPGDVDNSFYPYANSAPTVDGVRPGMIINAENWQIAEDVLDPAMLQFIKDGAVEISVGDTTSFDLHPNYVQATRDHLNTVTLGDEPGQINNYVAGRPFVEEPDLNDSRAGEKLAWNYKYGYNWGDNAAIYPFYWRYRDLKSGNIERTIKFNFHFLNFKHRVNQDPLPEFTNNPSDIFRGIYVEVLDPFDVKNTQLLIYRYDDDLKRDDSWLYLGFQRRVRRLSTGQVTDSFLGSDLMIEDFEGYNGRISDMNWTYKGTRIMLLPFYNHSEVTLTNEFNDSDGYQFVKFGGKGGCFPQITWQLRKAYELEATPTNPSHPISKRTFFVDAQTFTLPRTLIYDRKGELWKSWIIGQAHPEFHLEKNKGSGVSIDDSFSMVDVQAQHCTTGQFKGQVDPSLNPRSIFTVQNMRSKGQ